MPSASNEAKAFARLLERGLTRRGIAERCGVSQKLVPERLALLTLDEDFYPRIADGTIPPGAIRPLIELARVHPGAPRPRSRRDLDRRLRRLRR